MAYYKVTKKQSGGSATLITKNIAANGTYNASSDNADGYSSVIINVPIGKPCLCSSGEQSITLPIKASENLIFKFDLYFSYGPTNVDNLIIGDVFSTSGWLIHTRGTDLAFRWGSGSNYAVYSLIPWAKNEIEVNTTDGTLKINGVTQTTGHTVLYTSGEDIKLFGVASHYSLCCMGAMKVYKDGNLYMKLSPREINGRACYYDEIGETAYYSTTGTDLYYVDVSENSCLGMPTFTQTTIGTETSTGVITFTDDWNDYDFIIVRCENTSSLAITEVLVTPNQLNFCWDNGNDVVFNQKSTNIYSTYHKTDSTTWTRQNYRTFHIIEVLGITCTNYTVTETVIFTRNYSTASTTITSTGLLSYDMLMISSSNDGVIPNSIPITKGFVSTTSRIVNAVVTPYNKITDIQITDTTMSSAQYHYVSGIKFTSS